MITYIPNEPITQLAAGMSLRDHYAGLAMQSMFFEAVLQALRSDNDLDCGLVAEIAYKMADAMMKERNK